MNRSQFMFTRKRVVSATLLITAIICVGYALATKNPIATTQNIDTSASSVDRVFIEGIHNHVDAKTALSLESTLYDQINSTSREPTLFTASIRPDSSSKVITPASQTTMRMLIDVYPIEATYSIHLVSQQGFYSIQATCAPQPEQLNTSTRCMDRSVE